MRSQPIMVGVRRDDLTSGQLVFDAPVGSRSPTSNPIKRVRDVVLWSACSRAGHAQPRTAPGDESLVRTTNVEDVADSEVASWSRTRGMPANCCPPQTTVTPRSTTGPAGTEARVSARATGIAGSVIRGGMRLKTRMLGTLRIASVLGGWAVVFTVGGGTRPARYGPFYRTGPTQDNATIRKQLNSARSGAKRIVGRMNRASMHTWGSCRRLATESSSIRMSSQALAAHPAKRGGCAHGLESGSKASGPRSGLPSQTRDSVHEPFQPDRRTEESYLSVPDRDPSSGA
jgi:hypothetical protein